MAAGGIIGGVLGGIGGAASLLILNLSGTSMEEVRYWQYKWRANRDDAIADAYKVVYLLWILEFIVHFLFFSLFKLKQAAEKEEPTPALMKSHDAKVGEKITLENVK